LATQSTGRHGTFLDGNGGIDSTGLTLNDPSYDPSLVGIHDRLLAWNPGAPNGQLSDSPDILFAGVDRKDSKDLKDMPSAAERNPWNFFVRGNVILAQGFSQADVGHFDENTESIVLGADYRLTPHFLVGVKAAYGHTDVNLDHARSMATVDSYSPGVYASYANNGWYVNAMGDYLHNAYTQDRVISFLGQSAHSAPAGNEGVADLDGGYDFHHGAFTSGPVTGLQYTHLTVDGYSESGSVAALQVREQQSDSLRSRLGWRVSYASNCHGIKLTPHLSATWQHEFMDQSRGITSQFENTGLGSFNVRTESPQRDFAMVDAGVTADLNRTVSLFAEYMTQVGQANYFGQSVQAGVKFGF
jgi:outer membrane autotransporter protein